MNKLLSASHTEPDTVQRNRIFRSLAFWFFPLLFLAVFYFYPLGSIFKFSLERSAASFLSQILAALRSPSVLKVILFTFRQAILGTLLTLIIGIPGAYLFARYDFPGKSLIRALTSIPFVMPTLVVAAAFNALLGPAGWVNLALMQVFNLSAPPIQFINTLGAILVALVFYNTTIVLRTVGDFWAHIDPRLTQAAQVLGANRWRTISTISLPLLRPAIAASALLVFLFNFTSFGVILILGGPRFATLEVEIYYQTVSLFNLPLAAVLSFFQLAFTLGLTLMYTRLSVRISQPMSVRPRKYTQQKLLTRRSRIFAALMILILITLLLAPLTALAVRSFTRLEPDRGQRSAINNGFTLEFYKQLSVSQRGSLFYSSPARAIGISLAYALGAITLSLALGIPAAWALAHDQNKKLNRWLDPLIMLPLGTSAVTLGLGFILALGKPPLDLRASPLLVPLAHTLVAFPFVVRSLTPAIRSIRPQLREAAAMLGASPSQAFRTIDLPLIGRSVLVAATFAFAISLGEFGATAMIARPEFPTLPVMIFRYLSQPGGINYGQAMALSTILMAFSGIGMLVIERLRIADIGEF
jgi:thiamine transport system permease protein